MRFSLGGWACRLVYPLMHRLLTWITTLSLDAPLVAVAWQALLGRLMGSELRWEERALVFVSVWLGYTADRWMDARRRADAQESRHAWHRRHAGPILVVWVVVLLASLAVAIAQLSARELASGFTLVALSLVYAAVAQRSRRERILQFVKTFGVGALVALSAALFALPWRAFELRHAVALVSLTLLFALNCAMLRRWQRNVETESNSRELITAAAAIAGGFIASQEGVFGLAILSAALLLATLDRARRGVHPELRRSLADIALMTPFALLPFVEQAPSLTP